MYSQVRLSRHRLLMPEQGRYQENHLSTLPIWSRISVWSLRFGLYMSHIVCSIFPYGARHAKNCPRLTHFIQKHMAQFIHLMILYIPYLKRQCSPSLSQLLLLVIQWYFGRLVHISFLKWLCIGHSRNTFVSILVAMGYLGWTCLVICTYLTDVHCILVDVRFTEIKPPQSMWKHSHGLQLLNSWSITMLQIHYET